MRRLSVRIAVRSLVGSTHVGGSLVVVDATARKARRRNTVAGEVCVTVVMNACGRARTDIEQMCIQPGDKTVLAEVDAHVGASAVRMGGR